MENETKIPFLRSVLSGPDGGGSTARYCTLIVVVAAVLWVSGLTIAHRTLPDLTGLTIYETSLIAALYGTNKITAAMAAKKADCNADDAPAPR